MEAAEPILELALQCRNLCTDQIEKLEEDTKNIEATILSELNQRFAAWAAFLGVFAEPRFCLDRRLSHHIEVQEQILRLMDIIKRNLDFVFEADDSLESIELHDTNEPKHLTLDFGNLEAISEAIERLNQVGIATRQSSVTSHTTKARGFAEKFDFTSFEGLAYLALKTMYSAASEELLELLTQSMIETYATFLHLKHRHEQSQASGYPSSFYTVSEESDADADVGSHKNIDVKSSQQASHPAMVLFRTPSPPAQVFRPMTTSQLTSIDSHIDRVDYPRPAKERMTCNWCFNPLSIHQLDKYEWRKHIHGDHKPYLCLSKKCPESSPRFASSRVWSEHMMRVHGQDWYRGAYATSSWICSLCNYDSTTFRIPDDLAGHLADTHANIFGQPEIQAIVQQSQIKSTWPHNQCPFCCLSFKDKQSFPSDSSKKKEKGKAENRNFAESQDNINVERSLKRDETATGHTDTEQCSHSDVRQVGTKQQLPGTEPKSRISPPRTPLVESIHGHIARHLQTTMALTLRMISMDAASDVSAQHESARGSTNSDVSRADSIQSIFDLESNHFENIQIPEDGGITHDSLHPEIVPDLEEDRYWNNLRPNDEDPMKDEFLLGVINSGAFRSHWSVGAPPAHQYISEAPRGDDEDDSTRLMCNLQTPKFNLNLAEPLAFPYANIPFQRNLDFVDRGKLMTRIRLRCSQPGQCAALVGLAGSGKSQLAIEYAHRIREQSSKTWVFWVHASNPIGVEQGFREIVGASTAPAGYQSETHIIRMARDRLSSLEKWLLILDNVDDNMLAMVSKYLPKLLQGSILITSQHMIVRRSMIRNKEIIAVEPMSEPQALRLIQKKLDVAHELENAIELATALEYMPLAIVQAVSYICERGPRYTLRQYLTDYQKRKILNYKESNSQHDQKAESSIILTWQISFEHIRRTRQSAADLLSFMSFFDPQGIPEVLAWRRTESEACHGGFEEHNNEDSSEEGKDNEGSCVEERDNEGGSREEGDNRKSSEEEGDNDESSEEEGDNDHSILESSEGDDFEDDMRVLMDHALVSLVAHRSFTIHPLVQFATQEWLESNGHLEEWRQRSIRALFVEFPVEAHVSSTYCQPLLPHVKLAALHQPKENKSLKDWASLMHNAACYVWKTLGKAEALSLFEAAIKARKSILGQKDEETLRSMQMAGLVYGVKGEWKRAEELQIEVLETTQKVLGPEHHNTLDSMANMALIYRNQEQWEEAEEAELRVLKSYRDVLGPKHPNTLKSMANMSLIYRNQEQWEEAEELELRVLESYRDVLGPKHPNTLKSMTNMSLIYRNQEQWEEAEELELRVLESYKDVLDPEDPNTLNSMASMALIYKNQKRWQEAEGLEAELFATMQKLLGVDHIDTLNSMDNLARTWQRQGRAAEAISSMERCFEQRTHVLGPHHPDTEASLDALRTWINETAEATSKSSKSSSSAG